MARLTGEALGHRRATRTVCSTGVIGALLPMERIMAASEAAALSPTGGSDAAHAIMTTDTVDKQVAVELRSTARR